MALFDFSGIFQLIQNFLGPFGKLIDLVKKGVGHVTGIITAAVKLKDSILGEIDGWKNFKQDIRFKQRAIVLESAVQKTKDLIQGIPDSWHSIVDIVNEVKDLFKSGSTEGALDEAASAAEDIEAGGLKSLLSKFPRLARGLERSLGIVALVVDALEKIANAIDDLQTILDELKRIRLEFEKLDTIFLSQSNKRKTLKLDDGSTIRIRVGKLHASA